MTLSVRTRFEVFKRDRFTCSYCGKHPPEVLLEADHIVPRAAGGSDDLSNLTTACTDCNRGKGGRMLEEGTAPAVNREAVAEMQERIEQAQAYMEALGALQGIAEQQRWRVVEAWAKAYDATLSEKEDGSIMYSFDRYGRWPDDRSVRNFIKKLGLEGVLDAVDITASRIQRPTMDAVRYFYGVCHRSIREGREPLAPQQPSGAEYDAWGNGIAFGEEKENDRIRDLFLNRLDHGLETFADVVQSLWPESE
jgi:hypothetical protein